MKLLSFLLNAFFPFPCPVCGNTFNDIFYEICKTCSGRCQDEFRLKIIGANNYGLRELAEKRRFFFNNLTFLSTYNTFEKSIMHLAKFQQIKSVKRMLLEIILRETESIVTEEFVYIIPAPSHHKLVEFLAEQIAARFNLQNLSLFTKISREQNKSLNRADRFQKIQESVNLSDDSQTLLERPGKILILDDLWTTGATMNYMCSCLCRAGVSKDNIEAFVLFAREKNQA